MRNRSFPRPISNLACTYKKEYLFSQKCVSLMRNRRLKSDVNFISTDVKNKTRKHKP